MNTYSNSTFRKLILSLVFINVIGGLILIFDLLPPLIILGCVFIVSLVLLIQFVNQRNRKVVALTQYLKALNRGDYHYDLNAYEEGELAILHSELNKTTVNLVSTNEMLQNQKDFLNKSLEDITHQLKTPITALSILNDLQDQSQELIQNERIQIQRLHSLTQSILRLVKLDAKTQDFHLEEYLAHELVEEALILLNPISMDNDIMIEVEASEMKVICDKSLTVEAIQNVIQNKIRYASKCIRISFVKYGPFTDIIIEDDGEKIEHSQREKVFERFYSGVNKAPESVGIGLSLSKEIMLQQNGNLSIKDENSFVFRFRNVTRVS